MGRKYRDLSSLDRIELEIPHVRCAAHSLRGDRHAADLLVAECLSTAVADRVFLTPNLNARAWLLRILWRLHGADQFDRRDLVDEPYRESSSVLGDAYGFTELFSCFRSLDDKARFTLVIVSANKLSHVEAAYVFDISVVEFQRHLAEARSRLGALVAGDGLPPEILTI